MDGVQAGMGGLAWMGVVFLKIIFVCRRDCLIVLQVYRRELEEGGVVIDPLKASYTVKVSTCTQSHTTCTHHHTTSHTVTHHRCTPSHTHLKLVILLLEYCYLCYVSLCGWPRPPSLAPPLWQGITAREVISYFFDKETRLEWEGTLESVKVVEKLSEDTFIFHQLHKRVWPSTQRETLFCSHLCTLTDAPRPENTVGHTWMVCNFSLDHPDVPVSCPFTRLRTLSFSQ